MLRVVYKNEEESIMTIKKFQTEVQWEQAGVLSTAYINKHQVLIDEPATLGGTDQGPNPVEYILAALGGCINVLVVTFAERFNVEIKDVKVAIEGDIDTDGFLGINPNARVGYEEIRYSIHIDSPSSEEKIHELIAHVEKFCPVKDTLAGTPVINKQTIITT